MNKIHAPSLAIKLLVSVFFFALLGVPIFLGFKSKQKIVIESNDQAKKSALDLFGFYLEEVSSQVGVNFTHEAPKLDKRLDHIMPQIASVGASISVCDFNNDGWNDFYLTTSAIGKENALYKNLGDGTFQNVSAIMNIGDINKEGTGVSMGSVWGDVDNDGFEDLFVYKWGRPMLFLNKQGNGFQEISNTSGLPAWLNTNSAIWFDYNNDGNLDLFIGGYYKEHINLWQLENTLIMPESFEYANNGGRNYLMENQGNGTFKEVAFEKGLMSTKWTLATGAIDFNNDGFQDLFIANDYSVDELYINIEGQTFKEIGKDSKVGYAPKSGMNVSIADVGNNGNFSIYVSNITEMGILLQGNNLWQSVNGSDQLEFKNNAGMLGVELGGWSYGSQFGDLNNDGYLDLYLANGFISATKNNSYWYDYSKITGGNKSIISDASNWPDMEGRSQSGFQHNKIWINNNGAVFADVTDYVSVIPPYDSRAVVMVDLWNRGVLDVIVANQNNSVSIFKNQTDHIDNWIELQLEGTTSNKSAIGAKVTLVWADQSQSQFVSGGIGFSSQNQRALHFGIGENASIDKLIINWPSGLEQVIESLEINKVHKITEGNEIS